MYKEIVYYRITCNIWSIGHNKLLKCGNITDGVIAGGKVVESGQFSTKFRIFCHLYINTLTKNQK